MRFASVLCLASLTCLASSSRCPEPRKPHLTSCTVFYNCVNLPGGGYVWVPSKCNKGLIFQPYLRMCVVPGDIWTCDTLSTEHSPTIKYEVPELTHSTDTSYLGYTQEPLKFSEAIDSYVIDNFSDSPTNAVTAYPVIEFEELAKVPQNDKNVKNASYHKEENLYASQGQMLFSLIDEYKDIMDNHYKWLNKLMNQLQAYKESAVSDSFSVPVGEPVSPTESIVVLVSYNHRQNISFNYVVQSYTERNELYSSEATQTVGSDDSQISGVTTTTSALELLIDSLDSDNSIIQIRDNLGNKQYLTTDRYRALAHRLTPSTVSVVACTRNVRLPNKTDCHRYYTCEPKTATVVEYFCPLHTAFNAYSRICDVESAKTCATNGFPENHVFIEYVENKNTPMQDEETFEEKLCRELGKIKDPASDSHYYICYSVPDSEDVKSIRMTCPNTLIFCQSKKVCTTKRLCDAVS